MNKKFNSGLAIILPNKKFNLFVIFVIVLGIISGSIFLMVLNDTDKTLVVNQINNFFSNVNSNNINNFEAFKNSIIENFIFVVLTWVFGMSIIGILVNIFLVYLKGFIVGFTISSFLLTFKYKGIIASVIYVLPSALISILSILIITIYSVLFTIYLWKVIFLKDKSNNISKFLKKYFIILIISILMILVSSLLESYLVPSLLKLVIKLFI